MKYDVSIISCDSFVAEEVISPEIPDVYITDGLGNFCFAATIYDSENAAFQLIDFLFQGFHPIHEVYRNECAFILNLTPARHQLIDFDYLEKHYAEWIDRSGRENTMNEYGTLIDFIGFTQRGRNKKYALMVVSNERFQKDPSE